MLAVAARAGTGCSAPGPLVPFGVTPRPSNEVEEATAAGTPLDRIAAWIAERGEVSRRELSEHEFVSSLNAQERHALEESLRAHPRVEMREHGITHIYTARGSETKAESLPSETIESPDRAAAEVVSFAALPPPVIARSRGRLARGSVRAIAVLAVVLGLVGAAVLGMAGHAPEKSATSEERSTPVRPTAHRSPQPAAGDARSLSRRAKLIIARGDEAMPVSRPRKPRGSAPVAGQNPPASPGGRPPRPEQAEPSVAECPLGDLTIGC